MTEQVTLRNFPSRPRNCDWCDKRGMKIDPLVPVYITSPDDPKTLRFWVHKDCAQDLIENPKVETLYFVPYEPPGE